ncbi:MAG TPA: cytochrome c oxidase assembly protein [Gemmatimonadaceae bacterium]|nr:cytochrome c oxidase assembly protein [Gemmatimonadaceae bacterium]
MPQRVSFAAGLLVLLAALSGPLRDLGDRFLASAHMLQLLLLALVAAPLLLFGAPGWMLRPLLARRPVAAMARVLTRPAAGFVSFSGAMIGWHLPVLHNLALAHPAVHALQHLTILGTALLMWWPFLGSLEELPRLAYPGQMLYSFLLSLPVTLVAMSIVRAEDLLYPAYALAPRVWGLSPMTDQDVAGIILGVPGVLFFYGVLSVAFFRWSQLQADDPPGPPRAPSGAHG